jgi:hypothetical protein
MAAKKPRKYAFVPRLLAQTAFVGVVPACALAAIDGCSSSSGPTQAIDSGFQGVAAVAYPAYESGAPEAGSDAPTDAPSDVSTTPDVFMGVAAVAYPAYEAGVG